MKIKFLGGAGTVTGSKYLLESAAGKKILIDCGLFQGLKQLRLKNWDGLPVDPASIHAVFLTHAHIDHSGYLPKLVKEGFRGNIYSTQATKDLCRILLLDSAFLMEEEADLANKRRYSKHHPALPLFTEADVNVTLPLFSALPLHQDVTVEGFKIRYSRVGHILGAASILVEADGVSIAFSGDVGRLTDPIMRPPEQLPNAQYLVLESTYGDRKHPSEPPLEELADVIARTAKRRGSVLIPSFAVGRAQHLLYLISELKRQVMIPDLPVYLDSPMAVDVSDLYVEHQDEHKLNPEQCRRVFGAAHFVRSVEESRRLTARTDPRIVISASGMATGGRVLHHIKSFAANRANTILFAGYQAPGTRGAKMLAGAGEVKIHGELVSIHCEVTGLASLSAHADSGEILAWLKASGIRPKKTFITHGEPAASDSLRALLQDELKVECVVPALGDLLTLS